MSVAGDVAGDLGWPAAAVEPSTSAGRSRVRPAPGTVRMVGGVGSGSANRQKISGDELAGLLDAGLSAEVIADRLGCTARTVRNTAHRHRLALPSQRARQRRVVGPRVAQAPAFPQLYEPGWLQQRVSAGTSLKVIAADVGCSVSTVRTVADRLDVTRRRAVQLPELRDRAWLVDAYVTHALTTATIAAAIGASDSAVSAALARAGIPARRPVRDPRLSDRGWLRQAYVDEQRSAPAIASHLGVHPHTVYLALARAGIPRRAGGSQRRWRVDVDWLRTQYLDEGRSAVSIAAQVGQHPATVRTSLARHGIRRPSPRRPGPARLAAGWKRHRSLRELAHRYRASPERVELWLAEIGIFVRSRPVVARRSLRTAMRRSADVSELAHQFGMRPMRMRIELLQHHLELRPAVAAAPPPVRRPPSARRR